MQELNEVRTQVATDLAQEMEAAFQARLASLIQSHQQEMAASQLANTEQLAQRDSQHRSEVEAMEEAHQMVMQRELDSLKSAYSQKCTSAYLKQKALKYG